MTGVVSAALGRPVRLAGYHTTAVAYEPGSPATGALVRVEGATTDGRPWSLFLKVLQHPRHWPRLGQLPAAALPEVHPVLVPAFTGALRAAGGRAAAEQVAFGYVAGLAVRAGFTSLPFERLGEPVTPALAATFRERAALTRFIADLALSLP